MLNKVGIVIVNYNTFDILVQCIESIIKHVKCEYEIFLVDNNSSEEIRKKITEKYHDNQIVNLIMSEKNLGYSGGNNLGCHEAILHKCKIIAIVNSDIEFINDAVSIMAENLSEQVVVAGPKIINLDNEDGQHMINTYNYIEALLDRYPFYIIKKLLWSKDKSDNTEKLLFQGMVSGCCFVIDAKVFIELGLFDDNVFLYSEERILSIKLNRIQKKVCYDPLAIVLHKEGKSTQKRGTAFSDFHRYASDYYTIVRYLNVDGFKRKFLKSVRLFVFFIKCIKNKSYWKQYKKLIITMRKIEKGNYKIS